MIGARLDLAEFQAWGGEKGACSRAGPFFWRESAGNEGGTPPLSLPFPCSQACLELYCKQSTMVGRAAAAAGARHACGGRQAGAACWSGSSCCWGQWTAAHAAPTFEMVPAMRGAPGSLTRSPWRCCAGHGGQACHCHVSRPQLLNKGACWEWWEDGCGPPARAPAVEPSGRTAELMY